MSFNNPNVNDIQDEIRNEVGQIVGHLGGHLGAKIGNLQKQLNTLASLDLAQITLIQSNVQELYNALDGDPTSPGFQNLQSLLSLIQRVIDLEAWQAGVDSRLTNAEDGLDGIDTRLSAAEASVAGAVSDASNALQSAQAAHTAISLLDQREDGRHQGHQNSIGIIRQQLYATHVGLAATVIPLYVAAFDNAEAAALL